MAKKDQVKALLVDLNAGGYGTAGAATTAIRAYDFQPTPMESTAVEDDVVQPYLGAPDTYLAGRHAKLSFGVRAVGSGTAGLAPAFAGLLRMCGLSEVVTADTDVTYEPVSADFEHGTLHYWRDGKRRVLTGVRGSVALTSEGRGVPFFRFEMVGLYVPPSEVPTPAVDWSSWPKALVASPLNTNALSIHGHTPILQRLNMNLGAAPTFIGRVNDERVDITARAGSGEALIEEPSLADADYEAAMAAHDRDVVLYQHGTAAGNIVEVSAPKAQIVGCDEGEDSGVAMQTLRLSLKPDGGNDEFKLVFK